MKKSKTTLVPYGGLANRMRALGSLIRLMADTGANGKAVWFKDRGLNCRFDQLFQPVNILGFSMKEADISDFILCDRPRKKNFRIPSFFENIIYDSCIHEKEVIRKLEEKFDFTQWVLSHKRTYISSCMVFYGKNFENMFSPFVPTLLLQDRINKKSSLFTDNTIGIHIRRTDNVLCIKSSPLNLYIHEMQKAIDQNADTNFYLASDSMEEKKKLCRLFGERIITHANIVSRNTVDGIQDALVEMYLLSKTKKIFGSRYSTYSITAAEIGKIPHIDLNINS